MNSITICGDSWFSLDAKNPEKSFGEIIANNNHWNLTNLARGGNSNFAIALQIDKAIESNADFVIVGTTTPDRIEIPIINDNNKSIWENLKKFFNWKDWAYYQPEVYKKIHGIDNIWNREQKSSSHIPTVISESLNNLIFSNPYRLDQPQMDALKSYATTLYDSGIKRQIDCWTISDACRRLVASKIPFLLYIEPLFDPGDHWQSGFKNDIAWLDKKNVIEPWQFSYYQFPLDTTTAFHYGIDQSNVFATYIESRIKELL